MSWGKKIAVGIVSLVPFVALVVGVVALANDDPDLFTLAIVVSGLTDLFLAAIFIPHVHDNTRLGDGARIVWLALIGFPYITVAPLYWLIYMLPERPGQQRDAAAAGSGGAWYADPWGEAPYRWWDGERWTDWVTGPPGPG
jgi:hypothetical protein